jgi:hypothetical protein
MSWHTHMRTGACMIACAIEITCLAFARCRQTTNPSKAMQIPSTDDITIAFTSVSFDCHAKHLPLVIMHAQAYYLCAMSDNHTCCMVRSVLPRLQLRIHPLSLHSLRRNLPHSIWLRCRLPFLTCTTMQLIPCGSMQLSGPIFNLPLPSFQLLCESPHTFI